MRTMKHLGLAAMAATALALAGCGGGGSKATGPTPKQTCEDAGGSYADGTCTSAAQVEATAIANAIAAAKEAADGLSAESTLDDVEAAEALADMARDMVTDAKYASAADTTASLAEIDAVDGTLDTAEAAVVKRIADEKALAAKVGEQKAKLATAAGAIDTSEDALSTQAGVDAARQAIAGLRGALTDAADVSDADKAMYQTALNDAVDAVDGAQDGIDTETRRANQMTALSDASETLQDALAALGGNPTQALVDAANTALAGLNAALSGAADLTDTEKAPYQREATNASAPIQTAQTTVNDAKDDAQDKADKAMVALAEKLFTGIGSSPRRGTAIYENNGDLNITSVGSPAIDPPALKADDTTVADNNGWKGVQHSGKGTGENPPTYTATVYSNVGEPTMGRKFGSTTPGEGEDRAFEFRLNSDGALTAAEADGVGNSDDAFVTSEVAISSFTKTSGQKTFPLPNPNPDNIGSIKEGGSYYGVSGTYRCTPTDSSTNCSASVAAGGGLTLGGGAWTFTPGNPNARLMDSPDGAYTSYGHWLEKDGDDRIVGVFTAVRGGGEAPGVSENLGSLQGTAKYSGGAAGNFAISSALGENIGGDFTADVELNAEFGSAAEVSGTVSNFVTGHENDWEVSLNAADLTSTGGIQADTQQDATKTATTSWKIGGVDSGTGSWAGQLYGGTSTKAPEEGTGTFSAVHGRNARMVGAFGVIED